MIGSKNPWLNAFIILLLALTLYFTYQQIKGNPEYLTMGGITLVIGIAGIVMAWFNREKEDTKKEINSKATKEELKMVDQKIDQHVQDNRETYKSLFDLQKDTNDTVKDILLELTRRR